MTDYTKLIERMRTDSVFDFTTLGNEAADAIEALQSECAEHKENAMRNARIAVSIRAERDALQAKLDAMGKGEPVAYSVGNTLKWHEGKGMTNAQLFAAPKALAPLAIPADVLEAAVNMQTNHYRGPLAWAVKVIDFVADHGIGGTP